MRKALAILALFLTGLATIAFAINSHMMEDQRRHVGYFYLSLGIALTLASAVLGAIYLWYEPTPKKGIERGEGVNYSPALRKALARLKSFSDHLPTEDLPEHDVNEYHSILDVIGTEIHQDLSAFRIPPAKLIRHWAGTTWGGAYSGYRHLESAERFCKPADFRIALSGAMTFIDDCLRQIALTPPHTDTKEIESKINAPQPQPQQLQTSTNSQTPDDYKPDKIAIEILKQIDKGVVWESEIANVLKLDPKQVNETLRLLIEHGYITSKSSARYGHIYQLTKKGHKELDKSVYTVPFPSGKPDSNNTALLRAIERLMVIRDNLPKGDVLEKYVDIFHQTLREIESDTGHRLINFCSPPEEIKHRETKHPAARRISRYDRFTPAHSTFSPERYCDRAVFLIAINSAIASLKH